MFASLIQRRDALVNALQNTAAEIEQHRLELASAPTWYRPGMVISGLAPLHQEAFRHLERARSAIDQAAERRLELQVALGRLDETNATSRDIEAKAIDWLNRITSARVLLDELRPDPLALDAPPPNLTESQKILSIRQSLSGGQFQSATDLRQIDSIRSGLLTHILNTGFVRPGVTLARPPEIGVLLPVRLETRFDPPTPRRRDWQLRLLIIPDRPWFSEHEPMPQTQELDDVELYWRELKDQSPVSQLGQRAWERLTSVHGGPRALWLIRNFPPAPPRLDANGQPIDEPPRIIRPAQIAADSRFNRIVDFPSHLEVWLTRRGGAPAKIADLPVDPAKLILEPGDPDVPADRRWWENWEVAKLVGLGAEIAIGRQDPSDIDALYVLGLGGDAPADLIGELRDAGHLGVLEAATPTNTVDGALAAPLGDDPGPWRSLLNVSPAAQVSVRDLAIAFTGDPAKLGPLLNGDIDHGGPSRSVFAAIWPALWGHALADLWGGGSLVDELGLWAFQSVVPEGPLPTIRVADQPYGVLPTTSLRRWQVADGDPAIETDLGPRLLRVAQVFAERAEALGNMDGADTDHVLQLLSRTASANGYALRHFVSFDVFQMLLWNIGEGIGEAELGQLWDDSVAGLRRRNLYREPERRLLTIGAPLDITLPLVTPLNIPEGLTFGDVVKTLVDLPAAVIANDDTLRDVFQNNELPSSVLFDLVLRALRLTAARVAIAKRPEEPHILEPTYADARSSTQVAQLARSLTAADLGIDNPQVRVYFAVRDAIAHLSSYPDITLERALKACLDSASHRIDPFVTGIAWGRIKRVAGLNPVRRLGAYGWVDRPFTGEPGPLPETLLAAPSMEQAATAAILRDRSLFDPEPARWHMDVTSRAARAAERLAAEVEAGAHLTEALGRAIERAVVAPDAIEALRNLFPARTEQAGRMTCDGMAVLNAPVASLPLSAAQRTSLAPLRQALDVYGDLLLAEAVHHAANGRIARGGDAMDAAAGLGAPPNLDILTTRRDSTELESTVLFVTAVATPPAIDAFANPLMIAEPSLSAFFQARFGPSDGVQWTFEVTPEGAAPVFVTLQDLGLSPIDLVALGEDALLDEVQRFGGGTVTGGSGVETHRALRGIAQVIAKRPAGLSDIEPIGADDTATRVELAQRYDQLHRALSALVQMLTAQAGPGGDDAIRVQALQAAARWGVRPSRSATVGQSLQDQVDGARIVLATRLQAAPPPVEVADFSLTDFGVALAELATLDGGLPIFGVITVPDPHPFVTSATDIGTGLSAVELEWLSTVAAVRENLARLETEQLESLLNPSRAPLSVWSTRPDDPWQLTVPRDENGRRERTRLMVAFGPAGVLDPANTPAGTRLAVGYIDSFAELVPEPEQTAGATFYFNAPSARAPQAVLVVAPPDVSRSLDGATLVDVLAETRTLARARMVIPEDLGDFAAALPFALMPANGIDRRWTQA